jgi:molecular chaperone Hsp33
MSRTLHGLYPTAARLFAEAMAAGLLVAALQKGKARVNLQIECDGPARGLLVDSTPEGEVRGYSRAPAVHFPGDPRRGARAALGGAGFLSVIRDLGGGQLYRGAVELGAMEIAGDLRRYFAESEQVDTALDIEVAARPGEPLSDAAGLLVQKLPGGDPAALAAVRRKLADGALGAALAAGAPAQEALQGAAGEGFELLADQEVAYVCACSPERARAAVAVLGREGVEELLAGKRQAVVCCEFCRQRYVVTEEDLLRIARLLAGEEA